MVTRCVFDLFSCGVCSLVLVGLCFFFQAEDGIRDLVRSRGLGDVYKRQSLSRGIKIGHRKELVRQTQTRRLHGVSKMSVVMALSLIHI